ncbi:MAG: hypothetical protein QW628_11330 [Thermofilum sp.]
MSGLPTLASNPRASGAAPGCDSCPSLLLDELGEVESIERLNAYLGGWVNYFARPGKQQLPGFSPFRGSVFCSKVTLF